MKCARIRRCLAAGQATHRSVRQHLEDCADCTSFAARLGDVEQALREHRSQVIPPAGFAATVQQRLPQGNDLIGWAALRILPATLGLVLLLSWLTLRQESTVENLDTDPTDALVSWMLDPTADAGDDS